MHLLVRVACGRLTTVAIHVVNGQRVVGLREVRHDGVVGLYICNGILRVTRIYGAAVVCPVHEVVACVDRGVQGDVATSIYGGTRRTYTTASRWIGRSIDRVSLQCGELH